MLNLLKYNWKYNRLAFSVTFTLQLLLYGMLLLGILLLHWNEKFVVLLAIMNAGLGAFVYGYYVLRVFNNSLKSYYRRILPVTPIQEIFAVLLQLIIYYIAMLVLMLAFFLLLYMFYQSDNLTRIFALLSDPKYLLVGIFDEIWSSLVFITLVMVSMTITYAFKVRYRVWIGVVSCIIIVAINSLIHSLIEQETDLAYNTLSIQMLDSSMAQSGVAIMSAYQPNSIYYVIDGIFIVASVLAMRYIMKKKIEL